MRKSKYRRRWTLKSGKPASFPFPIDRELVWVCVGTDRSTGDSLGPFVGTMLTEAGVPNVYGTLDHPVHALNLAKMLERIEEAHPDACIVAIDACLDKAKSVGSMELRDGALEPGAGVGKVLPSVGDYNIIGIVNAEGFMEHVALQNTRLSLVIKMAKSITDFILRSLEVRMIEQVAATRGTERGSAMEKRDLKADLELCNKATPGPWEFERPWEFGPIYAGAIADALDEERDRANRELLNSFSEGCPHAIERAIKAEALARELVEALQGVSGMLDYATGECRCGVCEYCNVQKRADKALAKAKEVLGDE